MSRPDILGHLVPSLRLSADDPPAMIELTAALLLFLFPLAYSPGPGNMFFAANGARFGFSRTVQANVGYHITTWVVTLVIGLGFGWIATEYPGYLTVIKYAGSAYVLYLAWCLLRAGANDDDVEARHAGFLDGAVLLVLNPKAYLIIGLMFSQFVGPDSESRLGIILWITTIFTVNNLIAFMMFAYAGDRLASVFRDAASARRQNIFFGLMLAGVAIWLLLG